MASECTYPGGSARLASRPLTERSAPNCGASWPRHQSTLAVSITPASAFASLRASPDTVAPAVSWPSLTPPQRWPAFSRTASISRRAISFERDPNASLTLSEFTVAALASPGRNRANRSDASPVRFTLKQVPGPATSREELPTSHSERFVTSVVPIDDVTSIPCRPSGRRHRRAGAVTLTR